MEAALLVILCCIASNVLPFAIKSVFCGGGYGRAFGLIENNGVWGGEGSTLGTYAFACLPLVAYLQRHSLLAPARSWLRWVYLAAPGIAASAPSAPSRGRRWSPASSGRRWPGGSPATS